ncbi:uncharacterized protein LOC132717734, partial [Ruditapes philippinarum]|uniref:uncharacterized protein LOC132717734 n=1 Tax=Ruditapes philippinarum TaxID=129788 RepID=UPI00295BA9B6
MKDLKSTECSEPNTCNDDSFRKDVTRSVKHCKNQVKRQFDDSTENENYSDSYKSTVNRSVKIEKDSDRSTSIGTSYRSTSIGTSCGISSLLKDSEPTNVDDGIEIDMYVQYIKKQSQRKEMRRIKKKKETNKCSKSVNKLKVGHHKYTVKKNQSVNKDSRGCNQQKLIRAISVLNQKGKKKKSGCSVSSMKDGIDGLGLILQSKANKVVTERFLPGGESKSFNSADPLKIQSQVINEQVIEADIASSHSDDAKLDPRRVCNNDVTTHNVEGTVELRDAENAAPNNNQSSQNRRSDDVFETKEDSACFPPSGIHTATKTSREASPSPIRLSSSCLDDECNSVRKVSVQVVPNQLLQSEEQSDVKVGQGASPMSWNTNRNNDNFFNLKFKVNGEKSPKKKIDPIFKEEDLNHMMPLKRVTWLPINELPVPEIDLTVAHLTNFEPIMEIIDLITAGTPPTPHVSMRYELLRFCTLRSYPREDKPCLVKLSEAGFYYASDGDGVVCYCCGIRRYNWTAEDNPRKIHERINPSCKFLRKNEEVNVPVQYFGPYSKELMAIMEIPEPKVRPQVSEDVNNDWAPERIRAPASQQPNRANESGTNALDKPKHSQYATKTAREASYGTWPDTSSHTPEVLVDAGFFYAGFGDCARCFYCGIGLRHWTAEDDPWIEHARWSKNCVFVKQKKGEEFVNLVQLAVQYAQDNEANPS